jgi:hypothetical protein
MSETIQDLRAQLAQTDRAEQEARKFIAEQHKLMREAEKFRAEEQKLWRDWRMMPWVFGLTLAAAIIGGFIGRHL